MDDLASIVAAIEGALMQRGAKREGAELVFNCPAHDDSNRNCKWNRAKRVWHCWAAGCGKSGGYISLAKLLGIPLGTSTPEPSRQPGEGVLVRTYYYDLGGVHYSKERWEFPDQLTDDGKAKKEFRWSPKLSDAGHKVADMPLYWGGGQAPPNDGPIILTEGEKAADACWEQHIAACCGAWGAGQKTFGSAFAALKGREVWLSPDNDEAGATYMDAVAAHLRTLGIKARWVRVPLQNKEDLYDYFRRGGTVDAIWAGDLAETAVETVAHDHYVVRVPTAAGILRFVATRVSFGRGIGGKDALNCWLEASVEGREQRPYSTRIDLISATARTNLRLELSKMFSTGKDFPWVEVLNDVVTGIRGRFEEVDVSVDVFDIPEEGGEAQFLVPGLVLVGQPAVFFGDGESLKSWAAEQAMVCTALASPYPGFGTTGLYGPSLYVDFEDVGEKEFRRRIRRLLEALELSVPPGMFWYWPGRGVALVEQADAIQRKCRTEGIALVVVDSGAPACRGPATDDQVANEYFNALSVIGATSITICHTNKERDKEQPFGSVFWKNRCRSLWYFQRGGQGDHLQVGMYNRKMNNAPREHPRVLTVDFDGRDGAVHINEASFMDVSRDLDRLRPPGLRLMDVLRRGPLPVGRIAEALGSTVETVSKWLRAAPTHFYDTGTDGWALRARGED